MGGTAAVGNFLQGFLEPVKKKIEQQHAEELEQNIALRDDYLKLLFNEKTSDPGREAAMKALKPLVGKKGFESLSQAFPVAQKVSQAIQQRQQQQTPGQQALPGPQAPQGPREAAMAPQQTAPQQTPQPGPGAQILTPPAGIMSGYGDAARQREDEKLDQAEVRKVRTAREEQEALAPGRVKEAKDVARAQIEIESEDFQNRIKQASEVFGYDIGKDKEMLKKIALQRLGIKEDAQNSSSSEKLVIVGPDGKDIAGYRDPKTRKVFDQSGKEMDMSAGSGYNVKVDATAKAANDKQKFEAIISKLASANELPDAATSDSEVMMRAIASSKTLSQQDKSDARAYVATNTTPGSTAKAGTMRAQIFMAGREYPVINTQTGQLEMVSAPEINANRGTYAPAGPGATAMGKEAVFKDLHYNIDKARKAIDALDDMDAGTRAALAYTLRQTDPRSATQSFLTGTAGSKLTEKQQDAVIALALLSENAMSLRSVAGMGQGSDDLRAAIQATLPSAKTPSKGYAKKQIDNFESVVDRLQTGVPKVMKNDQTPGSRAMGEDKEQEFDGKKYHYHRDKPTDPWKLVK